MSDNSSKVEKIQKSGKIAQAATNIVKIFCIACAASTFLAGSILFAFKNTINYELQRTIESGSLDEEELLAMGEKKLAIFQRLVDDGYIAETIGIYAITMGAIITCMAVVLHFVSKVFKDFRESYTPFTPGILKNLKIAFALLTIFTLSSSLGIGLIVGLASWCVLNIFEYGCELQKQSDETL